MPNQLSNFFKKTFGRLYKVHPNMDPEPLEKVDPMAKLFKNHIKLI